MLSCTVEPPRSMSSTPHASGAVSEVQRRLRFVWSRASDLFDQSCVVHKNFDKHSRRSASRHRSRKTERAKNFWKPLKILSTFPVSCHEIATLEPNVYGSFKKLTGLESALKLRRSVRN